jgi:hypothetical protein
MNYQIVAVWILHNRHVTARRLKRLGGETHLLIFQMLDRFVEVVHLECGASPLVRGRPLRAPTFAIASVSPPTAYSIHFPLIISSDTLNPSTPS